MACLGCPGGYQLLEQAGAGEGMSAPLAAVGADPCGLIPADSRFPRRVKPDPSCPAPHASHGQMNQALDTSEALATPRICTTGPLDPQLTVTPNSERPLSVMVASERA